MAKALSYSGPAHQSKLSIGLAVRQESKSNAASKAPSTPIKSSSSASAVSSPSLPSKLPSPSKQSIPINMPVLARKIEQLEKILSEQGSFAQSLIEQNNSLKEIMRKQNEELTQKYTAEITRMQQQMGKIAEEVNQTQTVSKETMRKDYDQLVQSYQTKIERLQRELTIKLEEIAKIQEAKAQDLQKHNAEVAQDYQARINKLNSEVVKAAQEQQKLHQAIDILFTKNFHIEEDQAIIVSEVIPMKKLMGSLHQAVKGTDLAESSEESGAVISSIMNPIVEEATQNAAVFGLPSLADTINTATSDALNPAPDSVVIGDSADQ